MSDTYANTPSTDDIDDSADLESARLEREADAILVEGETRNFDSRPIKDAVREDAAAMRAWSRARAERLRRAVEDEPLRASIYALGIGLVIGLLMAR